MIKILNKFIYYLKNIILPVILVATIYILMFMFQRLGKDVFGANFIEFFESIAPFILLMILLILNTFLKHDNVRNNIFYNITSFIVMITILFICYRALFDTDMYFWYKYGYKINFNYFADQIAAIKVMLYTLSFANIILMIDGYIKLDDVKKDKTE